VTIDDFDNPAGNAALTLQDLSAVQKMRRIHLPAVASGSSSGFDCLLLPSGSFLVLFTSNGNYFATADALNNYIDVGAVWKAFPG
jgi:hypothetical protein